MHGLHLCRRNLQEQPGTLRSSLEPSEAASAPAAAGPGAAQQDGHQADGSSATRASHTCGDFWALSQPLWTCVCDRRQRNQPCLGAEPSASHCRFRTVLNTEPEGYF